MSANNGLGKIIEKNEVILEDLLFDTVGSLTTTRHANGRDWWILLPEFNTNGYYRILLSPEGISIPEYQAIGSEIESGLGQSVFSPDGSKYARNNLIGGAGGVDLLDIYDFDRCTGLLSNHQQLMYADSAWAGGVAISPNSRFLYVSHQDYVFQFDLEADDIDASRDTVAIYDGFSSPFTTHFFMAQLAPDGKIYINSPNSVDVLHVIHEPNLKGDSCNFEQHGIQLPFTNTFSLPNYPHFNLGALEGSPCDTLGIVDATTEIFPNQKVEVFPNPSSGQVQLKMEQPLSQNGQFILYDNLGKIVFEKNILKGSISEIFDFQGFVKGMYFYEIRERGVKIRTGKVVLVD